MEKNQTAKTTILWGAARCPVCKGLGFTLKEDINSILALVNRSVCPSCEFYKNENSCSAWMRIGGIDGPAEWIFIGENSCDVLRTITRALKTIGITKSSPPVF